MKRIPFIILLVLAGTFAVAQSPADRKADKKARKEARLAEERANAARLMALFESRRLVLEADKLFDRYNNIYVLNSNLNFVAFDSAYSTIQLSFTGLTGWNGVGGVTIDGRITKMEINAKEGETSFTVNAAVQNKGGGLVTMFFRVSPSGMARVTMNGNFGERLSFQGRIVSLEETNVYKGRPQF